MIPLITVALYTTIIIKKKRHIKNSSKERAVNSVDKLTGVNRLCAQCTHECKQWQQVRVINCPFFKSKQQKSAKLKEEDTLQAQQNA